MTDTAVKNLNLHPHEIILRFFANREVITLYRHDSSLDARVDAFQTLAEMAVFDGALIVLDVIPPEIVRSAQDDEDIVLSLAASTLAQYLEKELIETGVALKNPTLEGYRDEFAMRLKKVASEVAAFGKIFRSADKEPPSLPFD